MILWGNAPQQPLTIFFLLDTALDRVPGKENDNHELI